MFGSQVLDISLGLVLVFLLMSVVLTAVQESIEAWLRSRAGDLNRAIYELFQNDHNLLQQFYDHPLIFGLHRAEFGSDSAVKALAGSLSKALDLAAPVADGAAANGSRRIEVPTRGEARAARRELPSYIPRETFAAALHDMFSQQKVTSDRLTAAYDTLDRLAGGDVTKLRGELEGWYDAAMDRASGWFKRRTHKMLFGLGLASALLLNVNAVVIVRHLATDQQARQYVESYAARITAPNAKVPGSDQIEAFQHELQGKVGLPIGWSNTSVAKLREILPYGLGLSDGSWTLSATFAALLALIVILLGYAIPAFAATLGAPFWFDVLNRIMVIRSTVKPKEKSPDERSQDGGKDKQKSAANAPDVPPPA